MVPKSIPSKVVGLLGEICRDFYSGPEIDRLFLRAGAPDYKTNDSKINKTISWLRKVNVEAQDPIAILNDIAEDFLE